MNQKEKIYFIISGVRDGFKRSHLLCNNNIAEVTDYIDDRRQISNSATEFFYSIEKTNNYSLATVFNPNTTDQVGRKAYISITLFVKNGYSIQGNLLDTLNSLMSYYQLRQGNEISNRFTEEMFEAEYANLSLTQSNTPQNSLRKNNGYFNYENISEISSFFDSLSINGYQKVYFLNAANIGVINQLSSFEKVTNFPVSITNYISDFKYGKYEVLLNGEPYKVPSNISTVSIVGFQGDVVTINSIFTRRKTTFTITTGNQNKSIFSFFPEDKPQPQHPHSINNSSTTNFRGQASYQKQEKPSKLLKAAVALLSIVLLSIIGYIIWEKYYKKDLPTLPPTESKTVTPNPDPKPEPKTVTLTPDPKPEPKTVTLTPDPNKIVTTEKPEQARSKKCTECNQQQSKIKRFRKNRIDVTELELTLKNHKASSDCKLNK